MNFDQRMKLHVCFPPQLNKRPEERALYQRLRLISKNTLPANPIDLKSANEVEGEDDYLIFWLWLRKLRIKFT